jgi:uridylate kinase
VPRLKIAIKTGGFLFPSKLNATKIQRYIKTLRKLAEKGDRLLVVTGGGENARRYINVARKAGVDESTCDQIGIEISRLNAYLLISLLGNSAYSALPTTIRDVKRLFQSGKIVVMGGLTPGHSTTAVGAIAAEAIKADRYIISSDVDGIYTTDPKLHRNAKKLEEVTTTQILKMIANKQLWAGSYQLDFVALKIIERSRIPTYFIDGRNTSNLLRVVGGEKIGTYIYVA